MKPFSILSAFLLSSALGQAETIFIGGTSDPGGTPPLTNNLMNAANWDNGLPNGDGTNPGTVALDATWADPADGGGIDLRDIDFTITGGATVSRGSSFIAHLFGSTEIVIENGTLAPNAGGGTRALRVRDSSSIIVEADGILNVGGNLEFGTTGSVRVNGGSVSLGNGWFRVKTAGQYAMLTFGSGNGSVTSDHLFDFQQGNLPYVDFLTGSGGTLDLTGADENYYLGLWNGGQLRVDGANPGVFAQHFAVAGSLLSFSGSTGPTVLGNPGTWPTTFLENAPTASADSTGLSSGTQVGQSFTIAGDAALDTVLVQLDEATSSADLVGSLTMEIFEADGSGLPTGSVLSTLTGELPGGLTTGSFIEFDLPGTVALSAGSYVVTITTSDADLLLNSTTGDLLADGALLGNTGGGWTTTAPAGRDLIIGLTGNHSPPVVRPPAGSGPNILVILADDMSWTDIATGKPNLGNGSTYHHTPHIDRLANEGVSFTSCYVHQNCAPTRAALLSGQYPARSGNGVYNVSGLNRGSNGATPPPAFQGPSQNQDVPAAHYTMAEMLWDAGYVTCHVGKYHVGDHEGGAATLPENQGFDYNFGGGSAGAPGSFFASDVGGGVFQFNRPSPTLDPFAAPYTATYITDILTPYVNGNNPATLNGTNKHLVDAEVDAAVEFLDNHRSGSLSDYPFYLQYHSYAVHGPVQPRLDLETKYNGITSTDPRHDRADYAGHMEGLDQGIGRILDYLDDPNGDGDPSDSIADNTLVIFFSDNGGDEGPTDNIPLRSRKGAIYEGGIRSPLIVRQPGTIPVDLRTDTLVHAVDFFPTLMQVAGGATSKITDGTSFYDHVLDPVANPRQRGPVFYHFPGYMDNRIRPCEVAIKDVGGKRYKLIYNYDYLYDPNTGDDGIMVLDQPWELYNITDDLSETTNLIGDGNYWNDLLYGPIADEMASDIGAWLTQPDPSWDAVQVTDNGVPLAYPPTDLPDVTVPLEESFRILNADLDLAAGEVTVTFRSATGYTYDVQACPGLADPDAWTTIASDIPGQAGSTTVSNISDPPSGTDPRRFYRAVLRP